MKKNLSSTDRLVRIVIFVFCAALYFANVVTGTWGLVVLVAGIVLLATALINWCPIYAALGIRTNKA